jgi:RNA polymerase sigma factor (sigma-70 family)
MTDSQKLLTEYVRTGSEAAFRELAARYVDLVYSAAVRLVDGDTHLAEDVTQVVFIDLARMARAMSREVMLGGWLHRHTCFVARKALRGERRRQSRERQAVEMRTLADPPETNLAPIAGILDDAINRLGSEDRAAILLRFFEQKDFRSVGEALGSNEEAARKRVDRALGKLQLLLKHRGVVFSATALGGALAAQAVTAAPAGLAATVSGAALAGAAAGGVSVLTIIKAITMTKLKIGIVTAVCVAGVAVPLAMHERAQTRLLQEQTVLVQQQMEQNRELASENERLAKQVANGSHSATVASAPSAELLKLRGEVGRLRKESREVDTQPITHDLVESRYQHAQELARKGDPAAALKEFLWCFDEGMPRVASYSGVRGSFLLSSIAALGEKYPEALAALRERRDQASQRMLAGAGDTSAAMDFAALNRALKEDQNTLTALDQLPPEDPRRQILASVAYDQLIQAQRYGDALSGKSYAQIISQFEILAEDRPLPANISNPDRIRNAKRAYLITSAANSFEALAGAGDLEHARMLAARLVAFDPSPETRALLESRAARAGQPALLSSLPSR